ncbi:fatty acid desaturase family protein [Tomitella gaofuii]|uniref:fatty acid desaturase family protein n=1 Tax=Tomitella gaofuii TaxID=2760083 RepID=UPI0015F929A4|nr:acyl-CoA desaturase [Tomitella gaofuii]
MAITDVGVYAHLTADDIESLRRELDGIREDVERARGVRDARYVRRTIMGQRVLEVAARAAIIGARTRPGLYLGVLGLGVAKSIENMELGHNVSHGQWDWMNEPEIHSTTWEWDMACVSAQWKHYHNYLHHKYTNVLGMDDDIGFGIMRVSRDQQWRPIYLIQPVQNFLLALGFEWGIGLHDIKLGKLRGTEEERAHTRSQLRALGRKIRRQVVKDYVLLPALSGSRWRRTLAANASANVLRNLWAYLVIFCGHFPDGAEKFHPDDIADETRGEWYLRQMLGTANFDAGPALAFMSGNLCYQIEHHLYPDLPSNRYAEIAERVRAVCDKYDLPYTTGPLAKQYLLTLRTIVKLSLPDRYLRDTADDAPETGSERRFTAPAVSTISPLTGRRRGLRTALRDLRSARRRTGRAAATAGGGTAPAAAGGAGDPAYARTA